VRRGLILALAPLLLAACGREPLLRWSPLPPVAGLEGAVGVGQVVDRRPIKHGDGDLNQVGIARDVLGIPHTMSTLNGRYGPPGPGIDSLRRLVADSLSAAGIGVAMGGPPTSVVVVEVHELWQDGYFGEYNADVQLDLVILDPATSALRARVPVRTRGHANEFRAYERALDHAHAAVVAALRDPTVRAALIGPPGPR
jgi:hypothetical protein